MLFVLLLSSNYVSVYEDLSPRGYNILADLDNQNELRNRAVSGDWEGINSLVNIPGYNHSIEICSTSCTGYMPEEENVWSSVYIIGGDDVYEPYEIKLYIW